MLLAGAFMAWGTLQVMPPSIIFPVAMMLFGILFSFWELRLSINESPGYLVMLSHVGPIALSRTEVRPEQVRSVLLKTERYFMPGYGHSASVGVQWRWQVGVFVVMRDAPTCQVSHSSDLGSERVLAEQVSGALQAPLVVRLDPAAIGLLEGGKRVWRWMWLVWLIVIIVVVLVGPCLAEWAY